MMKWISIIFVTSLLYCNHALAKELFIREVETTTSKGLVLSPKSNIYFGSMFINQEIEVTMIWEVIGVGTAQFTNFQITGSDRFTIKSNSCDGDVPGGSTCGYVLLFSSLSPLDDGLFNATFSFKFHGVDNSGPVTKDHIYQLSGKIKNYQEPPNNPKCNEGSIIKVSSQSVSELVPVVGAPFSMYYSSDHAPQFVVPYTNVNHLSSFNPHGWTVSLVHHYSVSQQKLFTGTGQIKHVTAYTDSAGNYNVVEGDEVYVFNTSGRHIRTRSSLTGYTKYTFNYSSGYLSEIVDSFGNTSTFTRSNGVLSEIQAPYGQVTNITVNLDNLISSITNPNNETYSITYHSNTDLISTFTTPSGRRTEFTFNASGKLTLDKGAAGNSQSFSAVPSDYVEYIVKKSALNRATEFSSERLAAGKHKQTELTPYGYHTTTVENTDNSTDTITPHYREHTKTKYDERFGAAQKRTYLQIFTTNEKENRTEINRTISPWPLTEPFGYNTITTSTNKDGAIYTEVFNKQNLEYTTTSPNGATYKTKINQYELPIQTQLGSDTPVTMVYDNQGRLTNTYQGSANSTSYTYSLSGYLESITNARNETTTFSYDSTGRITSETTPDNRTTLYSYDADGNQTGITPPGRPIHLFSFNEFGLMESYVPPAPLGGGYKNTQYQYNLDKQLTAIIRPDGQRLEYIYGDTDGLLKEIVTPSGKQSYTYEPNSDRIKSALSIYGVQTSFAYGGVNTTSETQFSPFIGTTKILFDYNKKNQRNARIIEGNKFKTNRINTSYRLDGKIAQVGDLTITYDQSSGRPIGTSLHNIKETLSYDTYGNIHTYEARLEIPNLPVKTLYSYALERDLAFRIVGKSETIQGVTTQYSYTYDSAGRLIEVKKNGRVTSTYIYDSNGNRTSGSHSGTPFTATFDDQDRMISYNGQLFKYTANGELSSAESAIGKISQFVHDSFGQLKAVHTSIGSNLKYSLDFYGRRIASHKDGKLVYERIYEGRHRIAVDYTHHSQTAKEFVYLNSPNSPEYLIIDGKIYKFLKDHLGSPRLIVEAILGTIAQRLDYTELGKITFDSNQDFQPIGFAGGLVDHDTKLVRFGARDYDPEVGRWTSKDPILFKGGDTNLFGYVENDPVNFADASGTGPILSGLCHLGLPIVADSIGKQVALKITEDIQSLEKELSSIDQLCPKDGGARKLDLESTLSKLRMAQAALPAIMTGAVNYGGKSICDLLKFAPGI
ncbi:RHS repeat domain-containing protein [Bdellovibrio bacteriovorus]|uniref:Teneurin-like YD-shell domain-containing protein n=1 Tax=Bdellovibrio bacteriovorus str. Tiberius TaxID=1069642 RepID=K7YZB1_BDEBC|nr:RHS repeat-associated core domain-containing protein [Bdellovibrio bacteriovorus]AFY03088.1 hypothetical protein Bdt_3413 [Bdellovibrio bacteriovorus str. Tiberius]